VSRSRKTNENRRARAAMPSARTRQARTPGQHLQNAEEILDAVRHAAEDFQTAPTLSRAKTAIRNFLEQGRSVTWAVEHLKSQAADWDTWWTETTVKLRQDPVAQWFYDLRNPIVKEGHPVEIHRRVSLRGPLAISPQDEQQPEGTGVIIDGDLNVFWVRPDGTQVPGYPPPDVRRWNVLAGTPDGLQDRSLSDLMQHYIDTLEGIVAAAVGRFGTPEG
jgi:hypothetical protein